MNTKNIRHLPSIDVVSPLDSTFASKRSFVVYLTKEGGEFAGDESSLIPFLRIPLISPNSSLSRGFYPTSLLEIKGTMVPSSPTDTLLTKYKSSDFTLRAFISTLALNVPIDYTEWKRLDTQIELEDFDESTNPTPPVYDTLYNSPTPFHTYYNPYFKSLEVMGTFQRDVGIVIKGTYLSI